MQGFKRIDNRSIESSCPNFCITSGLLLTSSDGLLIELVKALRLRRFVKSDDYVLRDAIGRLRAELVSGGMIAHPETYAHIVDTLSAIQFVCRHQTREWLQLFVQMLYPIVVDHAREAVSAIENGSQRRIFLAERDRARRFFHRFIALLPGWVWRRWTFDPVPDRRLVE